MINFENLKWLWLLATIFIFVFAAIFFELIFANKNFALLTFNWGKPALLKNYSKLRNYFKIFLGIAALFFLMIASLRPQWGFHERKIEQKSRDLLIALDISKSMLVQDMQDSRLDFAKKKISNLVDILNVERVGLILFSQEALLACPLTTDKELFSDMLKGINGDSTAFGKTSISSAIKMALNSFENFPNSQSKLLLVFTDGEDFSENLERLKNEAVKQNLCIVTVGVGTQIGGPIPKFDTKGAAQGHLVDEEGKIIISRLNPQLLRNLAAATSGTYITATSNGSDVEKIHNYIKSFELKNIGLIDRKMPIERYLGFAIIAFISLLIEWVI